MANEVEEAAWLVVEFYNCGYYEVWLFELLRFDNVDAGLELLICKVLRAAEAYELP